MGRSRKKRPPGLRRRRYKTPTDVERANKAAFGEAAWKQRCCAKCGTTKNWQAHHVIEKSDLKRMGLIDYIWDTRNALRVCVNCHGGQTSRLRKLPLSVLTDDNFEFAFFVFGDNAVHHLTKRYAGSDPRLSEYLTRWEEQQAA